MSTAVIDPRPELITEEAGSNQPVLSGSMTRTWETIGNTYEALTTGIAPGNGVRTVPAPHDHGQLGTGAFLAQPALRWQGSSESSGSTTGYFLQTYMHLWASCFPVYAAQEMSLVLFGSGSTPHGANLTGKLVLWLDGADIPFEFIPSQDPSAWAISASLGALAPGVHGVALRLDSIAVAGVPTFLGNTDLIIDGAEIWNSGSSQMEAP